MAPPRMSQNRMIKIKTGLPDRTFTVLGFTGAEALSTLYRFDIDLLSENHRIDFHDVLGSNASLFVEEEGKKVFLFNGIICRFSQGTGGGERGSDTRYSYYSATLVPKLWLAAQVKKMRKWLEVKSSDVIQNILSEYSLSGNIADTAFTHDYVLQYNESDFNVIARLLEEEDMYFYFNQNEKTTQHGLVTVKPPGSPSVIGTARYVITGGGVDESDIISSLTVTEEIRPNKARLADQAPKETVNIVGGRDQSEAFPEELLVREYPGNIEKTERGDFKTKIRLGTEQANKKVLKGTSNCIGFRSGKRFTLSSHYRQELNSQDYLLTEVQHECRQELSGQFSYSNSFTCIPAQVLYRAPRRAYRPKVSGIQTAMVTEEPDSEGWIKVRVPWNGPSEPLEHPRARVSQPWAGEGFGAWFVPKVEHEVVLDFVDSDPHKPVVTGRVYNLNKNPPYGHEAHAKTTIRTAAGHELTFDDGDTERVYRYSHKDEDVLVEENLRETVGKSRHMLTKGNLYESMNERHTIIKGDRIEKAGRVLLDAGSEEVHQADTFAVHAPTLYLKGMNVVIEGTAQLSLKVGGNFIDINPGGVFIQGTLVMINSGGAPGSGPSPSVGSPGAPEEVTRPK